MTKDEIIEIAREAGWLSEYESSTGFCAEIAIKFAELILSCEREDVARMIEDAPTLVRFAQNDQGGCLLCGFTPTLAAKSIRERT
jgi:hypothetical protein